MFNSTTDRRFFPEVVVPLAGDPTSVIPGSNAEKKGSSSDLPRDDTSNSNRGSLQEKGVAAMPSTGGMTLQSLRAEIEGGVVASGSDTIFNRTFSISNGNASL